jgi:hypothetical protein
VSDLFKWLCEPIYHHLSGTYVLDLEMTIVKSLLHVVVIDVYKFDAFMAALRFEQLD